MRKRRIVAGLAVAYVMAGVMAVPQTAGAQVNCAPGNPLLLPVNAGAVQPGDPSDTYESSSPVQQELGLLALDRSMGFSVRVYEWDGTDCTLVATQFLCGTNFTINFLGWYFWLNGTRAALDATVGAGPDPLGIGSTTDPNVPPDPDPNVPPDPDPRMPPDPTGPAGSVGHCVWNPPAAVVPPGDHLVEVGAWGFGGEGLPVNYILTATPE